MMHCDIPALLASSIEVAGKVADSVGRSKEPRRAAKLTYTLF